ITATQIMDPAILDAALSLADDRSAMEPARAMAMLVLYGQLNRQPANIGASPATLVDPSWNCNTGTLGVHWWVATRNPMPAGYERQIAVVIDRIRYDESEPVLMR